ELVLATDQTGDSGPSQMAAMDGKCRAKDDSSLQIHSGGWIPRPREASNGFALSALPFQRNRRFAASIPKLLLRKPLAIRTRAATIRVAPDPTNPECSR